MSAFQRFFYSREIADFGRYFVLEPLRGIEHFGRVECHCDFGSLGNIIHSER